MNKKDLSTLRRQFKTDSNSLELKQLYTAYMKKDNQNIIYTEFYSFDMKNEIEQEIYLGNFKKLLTGSLNSKIFELAFEAGESGKEGQDRCCALLDADQYSFVECCNHYVDGIAHNFSYDSDIVISFVNAKYNKPTGRKSRKGEEESLTGFDDTTYGFKFYMCSISKADSSKREIYYDADSEKFLVNSPLNMNINFSSPLEGFMFPAFCNNYADINKVVYYTAKPNCRNESLLTNILVCQYEPTAKEEQEKFEEIMRLVNNDKIKPEIMKNIYDAVNERVEANADADEPLTLNAAELREIFEESGSNNMSSFDDAFNHAAEKGFEFKASSIVPTGSRAIKISNGVADISLSPDNLGAVKQVVNAKGRKCLLIELTEDAEINGLTLETESL